MREQYLQMPKDYIRELRENGKYHKSCCFMDYYYDFHEKNRKSIEEYAKLWGLSSKGSTHKWIKEFKYEIERYFNFWSLKNNEHYNSVKKTSERQVNANIRTDRENKASSERQVNSINIIDINKEKKNQFRTIFSLFGFFRISGKESEALEAFLNVDDIEFDNLIYAVRMYLNDNTITHKLWLPNFLKEKKYVNYMKQRLSIYVEGEWLDGEYNSQDELFVTSTQTYRLTKDRMLELLGKNELIFSTGAVA
ncbi:MAG: hypothetical protein IE881_06830 [Epsilonproteobacteria bacterium]|nr:hypothetical protein [Campylobacterota bacterium]